MSRREPAPGFGDRLKRLRTRLGLGVPDAARGFGVPYMTFRKWELFGSTPSPHTLKHGVRLLNVQEWELLFSWLSDGTGELPWWFEKEVPVPSADAPLPPEIEEMRRRGPRLYTGSYASVRVDGPLPFLSIELLAQRARRALEEGDAKEAAAAEHELMAILCPRCVRAPGKAPAKAEKAEKPEKAEPAQDKNEKSEKAEKPGKAGKESRL